MEIFNWIKFLCFTTTSTLGPNKVQGVPNSSEFVLLLSVIVWVKLCLGMSLYKAGVIVMVWLECGSQGFVVVMGQWGHF